MVGATWETGVSEEMKMGVSSSNSEIMTGSGVSKEASTVIAERGPVPTPVGIKCSIVGTKNTPTISCKGRTAE